ncbi:hypothetical protein [Nocardia pseudovaccinii]|uniref:hypothetical protein n=1 Tax=Nocardia pseudovaccinii TaxID=189540 RepID=UPI0007A414F3|nr:hypothetical protein [Nocardia pseudovaccinii]
MGELTETSLAQIRDDFSKKVEEVKKTPDKINDAVDDLKYYAPLVYLKVSQVRDDIQDKLAELFEQLKKAVEGMFAPWLFLDYAAKWQVIGSQVRSCNGMQGSRDYNMEGRWDGSAYKSFKTTKESQQAAMTSIENMCNTIHDKLITVAEEGQNLYYNITNKLATIIAQVATFATETSATGGAAAIWTINNLNGAIVAAVELVVQALTDFVKVESKVYVASQDLKNLVRAPSGFDVAKSGKVTWPSSASDQFDNKDDDWKQDGAA